MNTVFKIIVLDQDRAAAWIFCEVFYSGHLDIIEARYIEGYYYFLFDNLPDAKFFNGFVHGYKFGTIESNKQ